MTDDGHREFFDVMYRKAGGNAANVPWARLAPNPLVAEWLAQSTAPLGQALVIACGLGDDAEALAEAGWRVTAFDYAPRAIEWCHERFPHTVVDYVVADVFDLPSRWTEAFSLVVEVLTIQSLSPDVRQEVVRSIAAPVALGGTLLVATVGRQAPQNNDGPPWPLGRDELGGFVTAGLEEVRFTSRPSPWEGFDLYDVEYRRHTG